PPGPYPAGAKGRAADPADAGTGRRLPGRATRPARRVRGRRSRAAPGAAPERALCRNRAAARSSDAPRASAIPPGSSPVRVPSTPSPCSSVVDGREACLAIEIVHGLDLADGSALRAHDDRVCDRAVAEAPHAAEHGAAGDAGCGEHHLAARQLLEAPVPVKVGDAPAARRARRAVIAEQQAALELPADAA